MVNTIEAAEKRVHTGLLEVNNTSAAVRVARGREGEQSEGER